MDRPEYLASLRPRLDDDPAAGDDPRQSDAELTGYLLDAVKEYSGAFPREREQEFTADGTTARYDLPADIVDDLVHEVSCLAAGRVVDVPVRLARNRSSRWYEIRAGHLVFGWKPVDGTVIRVLYDGAHVLPETGDCTVPAQDVELVFTYAMYLAVRRVSGNDANLQRWDEAGRRDDNPLIPQYRLLLDRYTQLVRER